MAGVRAVTFFGFILVGGALASGIASIGCTRKTGDSSSLDGSTHAPLAASSAAFAEGAPPAPARSPQAGAPIAADLTRPLRGTIAGKLAIVMRLTRAGDALEGTYFYEPSTTDLRLHGAITPSGAVHLDESSGKVTTGAFDGAIDSSGAFSGTWSDPKRTRALPFHVEPVSVAAGAAVPIVLRAAVFTLRPKQMPPADSWPFGAPSCKSDVHFAEAIGGIDPAREAAVNTLLRAGEPPSAVCDGPFEHEAATRVRTNEHGVLSVVVASSHYEMGMPHPSYGRTFINVVVPAGTEIKLADILTPSASDVIHARLRAELDKIDDEDTRTRVNDALALDEVDFAIEPTGLRLSTFNRLPHAYKGADGEDGFFIPASALAKVRTKPSPVDRLWP